MSILQLIVRRHLTTRAPDRRTQRGCTVPPLLREAAAGNASIPGIGIDTACVDDLRRRGSAASDREEAGAPVADGLPVRR